MTHMQYNQNISGPVNNDNDDSNCLLPTLNDTPINVDENDNSKSPTFRHLITCSWIIIMTTNITTTTINVSPLKTIIQMQVY